MKIELIKLCIDWVDAEPSRSMDIKYGKYEKEGRIFLYDYDVQNGVSVECMSDIPTTEQLKSMKIEDLKRQLSES